MTRREKLAYLAGIVDGEGTITIGRFTRVKGGVPRYQVRLLVVNTDLALITAVKEIVGYGLVYQSKADRTGAIPANWNPVHRYQVASQQALQLIRELRPFLIAKAEHAEVVLGMPLRTKNHYDLSALPGQEAAFARITALNRRGRKV